MAELSLTAWPTPPPGMARPDRVIPCDICGSDKYIDLWPKKEGPQSVRTVICKDCGLVFTNPQPDVVYSVGSYYRKDRLFGFRQRYLELRKAHLLPEPMAGEWIRLLDIKKESRVLDVGCGSTGIGGRIAEITGAKVTGIDPDPYAIEYCKQNFPMAKYINVSWQRFITDHRYDAIFLNQALEHQSSPANCLMSLRGLLTEYGTLGIAVPCVNHPSDYGLGEEDGYGLDILFRKSHLYSFSISSLINLLGVCGFYRHHFFWDNDGGKQGENCSLVIIAKTTVHSFTIIPENAKRIKKRLLNWHESRKK